MTISREVPSRYGLRAERFSPTEIPVDEGRFPGQSCCRWGRESKSANSAPHPKIPWGDFKRLYR